MRYPVGLLVAFAVGAAAVGIGCSAPAESSVFPESAEPELATPPAAASAPSPPTPATEKLPSSNQDGFESELLVHGAAPPEITSRITDPETGAAYAAGTFAGTLSIGGTVLESRGEEDVFLLKVDAEAAIQWARSVGSKRAESKPRVTFDGAHVYLIGMTNGQMNCGLGPLQTWSSDTFFFCVFRSSDGTTLAGGVFPTGNP